MVKTISGTELNNQIDIARKLSSYSRLLKIYNDRYILMYMIEYLKFKVLELNIIL